MANTDSYGSGITLGRMLVYILAIAVGVLLIYNYFKNTNFGKGADYTTIPTEMQINYIPSEFNFEADEETTLAILTNPNRYKREFDDLVRNFNLSLLHHVANRMDLPDTLKIRIESTYAKHHSYLKELYFNDFVKIRDTTSNIYESWYENNFNSATEALNEVASKYTCFLVNHVIMTMLDSNDGTLVGMGNAVETPCGIALTEGLRPMVRRLQDRAAIMDFSASQNMMEEKVERAIAELATMEVRDRKGLNKQLQTKIWGYEVSSTDIEVSAISVLKVGFKIDQFFEIKLDQGRNRVTVTLPEPTILSHEVYPRVDKLDVGWLREIENSDLNKNFNVLRREFRRDALSDNIMQKSKEQADELMHLMLEPIIRQLGGRYKLLVRYKRMASNFDDRELATENSGVNMDN